MSFDNRNEKYLPVLSYWVQEAIPNVYDDSLSLYELINKVVMYLNKVIEAQNGLTDEMNEFLEWADKSLEGWAKEQLLIWLEDGTLGNLINETLFNTKLDKTDFVKYRDYRLLEEFEGNTFSEKMKNALDFTTRNKLRLVLNGVYNHDKPVFLPSNTHLVINGTVKAISIYESVFETFDRVTWTPKYTASSNVIIEGSGVVDANALSSGMEESDNTPFRIHHASGVTIKGITIKNVNVAHAIEIGGSRDVVIEGVTFTGLVRPDKATNKYQEMIQIEHVSETGSRFAIPYDNTPTINVTVRGCLFESTQFNSVHVAIGSHEKTDKPFSNIVIVDNTFIGVTRPCIVPCNWENVVITNNTVKDCGYNFIGYINYKTTGIIGGLISNNTITNCGFKQDTFSDIDSSLIQVYVSSDLLIDNNVVNDGYLNAVVVFTSQNIRVTNNKFNYGKKGGDLQGVILRNSPDVPKCTNISITGNEFKALGGSLRHIHIPVDQVSDTHFVDNNVLHGMNQSDMLRAHNTNVKVLYSGKHYSGVVNVDGVMNMFDRIDFELDLGGGVSKVESFLPHESLRALLFSHIVPANSGSYIRFQKMDITIGADYKSVNVTANNVLQGNVGSEMTKENASESNRNYTTSITKIVGYQFNKVV